MEVLKIFKERSDETVAQEYVQEHTTASADIVAATLKNLEVIGCVKQVGDGKYQFVRDPMASVFGS
jgi:DNA-binding IclR family transcriptional regulator